MTPREYFLEMAHKIKMLKKNLAIPNPANSMGDYSFLVAADAYISAIELLFIPDVFSMQNATGRIATLSQALSQGLPHTVHWEYSPQTAHYHLEPNEACAKLTELLIECLREYLTVIKDFNYRDHSELEQDIVARSYKTLAATWVIAEGRRALYDYHLARITMQSPCALLNSIRWITDLPQLIGEHGDRAYVEQLRAYHGGTLPNEAIQLCYLSRGLMSSIRRDAVETEQERVDKSKLFEWIKRALMQYAAIVTSIRFGSYEHIDQKRFEINNFVLARSVVVAASIIDSEKKYPALYRLAYETLLSMSFALQRMAPMLEDPAPISLFASTFGINRFNETFKGAQLIRKLPQTPQRQQIQTVKESDELATPATTGRKRWKQLSQVFVLDTEKEAARNPRASTDLFATRIPTFKGRWAESTQSGAEVTQHLQTLALST